MGMMGALANAALTAGGRVVGVIPRAMVEREWAHSGLSELIVVDTMHARKAAMAKRAQCYVALPGGLGTLGRTCRIPLLGAAGIPPTAAFFAQYKRLFQSRFSHL